MSPLQSLSFCKQFLFQVLNKNSPMTRFELRTSGIGSDRTDNRPTEHVGNWYNFDEPKPKKCKFDFISSLVLRRSSQQSRPWSNVSFGIARGKTSVWGWDSGREGHLFYQVYSDARIRATSTPFLSVTLSLSFNLYLLTFSTSHTMSKKAIYMTI